MVLEYLVRHAVLAVTRDMIGTAVWGKDYNAMSNIVEVFINRLRQKLELINQPPLIVTVRGAGYMLRLELPVPNSKSRPPVSIRLHLIIYWTATTALILFAAGCHPGHVFARHVGGARRCLD